MDIYLPIAEMSVNVLLLLGMGGAVGFLSGLFGVGGGFLMTPLLIFIGVPPAVAVGSEANQIAAASVSGMLAHARRGNVDFRMGGVLLAGGAVGSVIGVAIFRELRALGQIDAAISLSYVLFLGGVGALMAVESANAILRRRRAAPRRRLRQRYWVHRLPLKMRFRRSKLYVSAIAPVGIGIAAGVLSAIMGVGGGFILVPAMIYFLGMATATAIGTSLFQIMFVTAIVTVLHAATNQTVDLLLAMLLLVGAVVGAQFGAQFGARLRGEQLRGLLALVVLAVSAKLAIDLAVEPAELYSIAPALR